MRLEQYAVVDEHAFERGVDPAFELVAVAWHRTEDYESESRKRISGSSFFSV